MKTIPNYSNYLIDENGNVFSKHRNGLLVGSTNPAGYHNFRLTGDDGYTFTWGRHRLMCFVYKHPGCDITELVVNHKNGIKSDDFLDNLEWVTQKENVIHAGENGLSEKCIPVSARFVDTNEVLHFVSYTECGLYFGLTKDAISYRIRSGGHRVFPERVQYRKYENGPWLTVTDIEKAMLLNSTSKSVMLRELKTGKESTYAKLSDLANYLKVALPTISGWLHLPDQPILPGLLQLKLSCSGDNWRDVVDPWIELDKSVAVRCEETGIVTLFEKPIECATVMFLKPTNLHHRLKTKGTVVFKDGFRYWYYSDYKNSPTVQ